MPAAVAAPAITSRRVYLVLLAASPTAFHDLSSARSGLEQQLRKSGALPAMQQAAASQHGGRLAVQALPKPLGVWEEGRLVFAWSYLQQSKSITNRL